MGCGITSQACDFLAELVIAVRASCGKYFCRHELRLDALYVTTAARPERHAKSTGVGVKFKKALNRPERDKHGDCLIELLDYIQRFASERVVTHRFVA